jgi:hypothetical protein
MTNIEEQTIRKAITSLGIERLLANVPQSDLMPILGLVSMQGLAEMMDLNYSTMRWHVGQGRIPRPTIKLNRRSYYPKAEAEAMAEAWKKKSPWKNSKESAQ